MDDSERAELRARLVRDRLADYEEEIEHCRERETTRLANEWADRFSPFRNYHPAMVGWLAAVLAGAATIIFTAAAGLDVARFWIAQLITIALFFLGGFLLSFACNREASRAYWAEYYRLRGETGAAMDAYFARVGARRANRIEQTEWWRRRFGYRYGFWEVAIPTIIALGFAAMVLTVIWGFATGRLPIH
jgi:hypothetical protein